MEDVKPEGWRQLLQPRGAAGKNSTSLLRRSSSWRRPGERGYYEGPAAQMNEPTRRARPLSCIEGGRMDKWLQTLERLQSRRLQNQIPPFADRTLSMPVLPNEAAGSNLQCADVSSLRWRNQTPSVCPSVCESSSSSLESVHIKAAPAAEKAQFCALAPVRFGWLPIQRRVILTDITDKSHKNSKYQQKLKSPITPVLLSAPAKLNGPRPNDREAVRPEAIGFRYWRTLETTPSVLHQVSGSASSEGGRIGPQAWNPGHAGPHPACRRGSAPESFSSSISSITLTSRKVTQTNSKAQDDLANGRRKALVVKVTEQRMKNTTSCPIANQEEMDHGVVLRRKATVVKMTEQRERFRHSYTEGLNGNRSRAGRKSMEVPPQI
ncbi:(E2-independent) E3 ubiquitin-conjugating enzyme FATS [Garra rufa]|uniref:(E2-independent) E3 ubiquitin-conjugating enzyme FATS n=1 Tax=Garra rufa TaxID=137080 RepID=UPI003CCE6E7A